MAKRTPFSLLLAAVAVLLLSTTALAQGPIIIQHSDPAWQGSYWNNVDLAGPAVLQRQDASIDFDWGAGSPDARVSQNGFSARWTRYLDTAGGIYRFTATSDDGIRITIDGKQVINQWYDHAVQTYTADVQLGSGHHLVVVEYYENGGNAVARVSWGPQTPTIQNWRGEYFNNKILSGSPALTRDDAQLNFNWGSGSPAPGVVNVDGFSARWTRTLDLPAGSYRFSLTIDDGGRLWVRDHLLIDVWQDQAARTYTGDIYLPGGPTSVRVEYYENTGAAVAQLSWTGGSNPPPPPPPPPATGEVVVDDTSANFQKGGSPTGWHVAYEGYGNQLTWTRNNDQVRSNYDWARWLPKLSPGRYEVFVFIPNRYTTTGAARYWISHAGGFTQRIVNQSAYQDQWVSLGTYEFRGTQEDYLSLTDVTYEPYLSSLIAFDAARWVPR